MQKYQKLKSRGASTQMLLRLQILGDPDIREYVEKLRAKYGKHVLPAEEVRRIVDKAMGNKTLTEVLHKMREESW